MKLRKEQSGLVSIVVTLVVMAIISVIVLSFAFLMRREQQQVLDRQLSTQAFYAAESGVSKVISDINNNNLTSDVTDCNNYQEQLPGNENIEVSCVLVEQSPDSLEYSEIPTNKSQVVALRVAPGNGIERIEISWQTSDQSKLGNFATNDKYFLPTQDFEDTAGIDTFSEYTGILRTDLIPVYSTVNRGTVNNDARALFLYPVGQPENLPDTISMTKSSGNNPDGAFVGGDCVAGGTPYECTSTITNISDISTTESNPPSTIYLRLKAIYQPLSVSIRAFDSGNNQLNLRGEQVVVDSTGSAGSVLRRIQVRVPVRSQYDYPEFSLESVEDICKRLSVAPGVGSDECPAN